MSALGATGNKETTVPLVANSAGAFASTCPPHNDVSAPRTTSVKRYLFRRIPTIVGILSPILLGNCI